MTSYFIELNEYKPQNRKCAEMAEFATSLVIRFALIKFPLMLLKLNWKQR